MKKIFIYYTLSGNGEVVADYLKDKYDIRKVKTSEPLPKNNFLRILSGGYKAMVNHKDKLDNFNKNISKYDQIVIGSPIWNDRLSSPINGVLDVLNLEGKKVKFILYSASGKANKASEVIKNKYNCDIYVLKEPLKNSDELDKLKDLL